jgi:hypothetical protein
MSSLGLRTAVFACTALLLLCGQGWSQRVDTFDPQGGNGGDPFRVVCPGGSYLRGIAGRAGNIIEKMRITCQGFTFVKAEGEFRPNGNAFDHGSWLGAGQGGSDTATECQSGTFVQGIHFNTLPYNNIPVVSHIRLDCGNLRNRSSNVHTFGHSPGNRFHHECDQGLFVVGFVGKVGLYVDAIGAVCAEMLPQ